MGMNFPIEPLHHGLLTSCKTSTNLEILESTARSNISKPPFFNRDSLLILIYIGGYIIPTTYYPEDSPPEVKLLLDANGDDLAWFFPGICGRRLLEVGDGSKCVSFGLNFWWSNVLSMIGWHVLYVWNWICRVFDGWSYFNISNLKIQVFHCTICTWLWLWTCIIGNSISVCLNCGGPISLKKNIRGRDGCLKTKIDHP